MRRIETSGNVLTIFFPQEEDSTLIGMFNADASFLNIFLRDNKMEKMIMWPLVTGRMYPMEKLKKDIIYLPRYKWYEAERPQGPPRYIPENILGCKFVRSNRGAYWGT